MLWLAPVVGAAVGLYGCAQYPLQVDDDLSVGSWSKAVEKIYSRYRDVITLPLLPMHRVGGSILLIGYR